MEENILRVNNIDATLIELLASAYLVLIEEINGDVVIKLYEKINYNGSVSCLNAHIKRMKEM